MCKKWETGRLSSYQYGGSVKCRSGYSSKGVTDAQTVQMLQVFSYLSRGDTYHIA